MAFRSPGYTNVVFRFITSSPNAVFNMSYVFSWFLQLKTKTNKGLLFFSMHHFACDECSRTTSKLASHITKPWLRLSARKYSNGILKWRCHICAQLNNLKKMYIHFDVRSKLERKEQTLFINLLINFVTRACGWISTLDWRKASEVKLVTAGLTQETTEADTAVIAQIHVVEYFACFPWRSLKHLCKHFGWLCNVL